MYTLHWQPPYDWAWMLGFLGARAVAGIETVSERQYVRSLALGEHRGLITVEPDEESHTLHVTLSDGLLPVANTCLERVGRLFDLTCDPDEIARTWARRVRGCGCRDRWMRSSRASGRFSGNW